MAPLRPAPSLIMEKRDVPPLERAYDALISLALGLGTAISCPECGTNVVESRRSYTIDADRLVDDVDPVNDEIPVYGWHCQRCHLTRPADPTDRSHRPPDVGPVDGWIVVDAQLATRSGPV